MLTPDRAARLTTTLSADNSSVKSDTHDLYLGLDNRVDASSLLAKGDRVEGSTMIQGDNYDDNDLSITKQRQPNDDIFSYILHVDNKTAVRLADYAVMDKLPNTMKIMSASVPPESGATIYYLTDADGALSDGNGTLPTFDPDNIVGTGAPNDSWSTSVPTIQ